MSNLGSKLNKALEAALGKVEARLHRELQRTRYAAPNKRFVPIHEKVHGILSRALQQIDDKLDSHGEHLGQRQRHALDQRLEIIRALMAARIPKDFLIETLSLNGLAEASADEQGEEQSSEEATGLMTRLKKNLFDREETKPSLRSRLKETEKTVAAVPIPENSSEEGIELALLLARLEAADQSGELAWLLRNPNLDKQEPKPQGDSSKTTRLSASPLSSQMTVTTKTTASPINLPPLKPQ